VVASRLRDQLDEVATTIRTKGHHALAVEANISKSESLAQMVAAAGQKFGLFLYLP
jgi:NAD(P)-dependent dehydrogenase (short-subunit alcohol dehydrogenase family)